MCGPNSDVGIDYQLSTHLVVDDFGVVQLLDFAVHHMPYWGIPPICCDHQFMGFFFYLPFRHCWGV